MNYLYKLIILLILIISIVLTLVCLANYGYLNSAIRHGLQYYVNLKGYRCNIEDLKFLDGNLKVKNIIAEIDDITIKLDNIDTKFIPILSKLQIKSEISVDKLEILENNNDLILNAQLSANHFLGKFENSYILSVELNNISVPEINISSGYAEFSSEMINDNASIVAIVNLSDSSFIHSNYKSYQPSPNAKNKSSPYIRAHAICKNIPIKLTKVIHSLNPKNELGLFFANFFQAGIISKGNIDLNLEEKYFDNGIIEPNNIIAEFIGTGISFKYYPNLPEVTNTEIYGSTKGNITELLLKDAHIAGFNFSSAEVTIDLAHAKGKLLELKGSGSGPVRGLTEFIPKAVMSKMQDSKINLYEFTDNANVELFMQIPLKENENNLYDVKAEIPSTSLAIFDNQLRLHGAKLTAHLLNKHLEIRGQGYINGFASNLMFSSQIEPDDPNYLLKINSKISSKSINKDNENKIGFSNIIDGEADLFFEHKLTNSTSSFVISSDLTNLEFGYDKLGIYKKKNDPASLDIKGNLLEFNKYNFHFDLKGAKKLRITGDILHKQNGTTDFSLPIITYNDTELKANILYDSGNMDISVIGKKLDLAEANLLDFLKKERDSKGFKTNLKVSIDQVNLKNNILINRMLINLKCNAMGYYEGQMSALIGNREIKASVTSENENENWIIFSANAGATLKAIGAYNGIKAGAMEINLVTALKQISPNQIIPIRKGSYKIEKFALTDTPFLTRLVSVVSLPGFLGMITNNKDIIFSKMVGEFEFVDGKLQIYNSLAEGPFFEFSINGQIDSNTNYIDIYGHVTPELYGLSSIVKTIPFVGKFVTGGPSKGGLISTKYKISQSY